MSLYYNKNYGKDLGMIDLFLENKKKFDFTIIKLKNMNFNSEILMEEFIENQKSKDSWIKVRVLASIYKDKEGNYWHIEKKFNKDKNEKNPFKVKSYRIDKNDII